MASHNHYQSFFIPMAKTTVKTCRCYEKYWRQLKLSTSEMLEFNYAIERSFSYRKYFADQRLLYHFCINCLFDVACSIPMHIIEFEMRKGHMGCIFKFRHNAMALGESCSACVNYVMHRYTGMFFITI